MGNNQSYQIKSTQFKQITSIQNLNLSQRCLDYIRQHKLTAWKHQSIDKYYFGQFHHSFADFLGIIYVPTLFYYQGQFKNGFPEGQGFLESFNQKHQYQGDFQYGVAHGNGVMALTCAGEQYQFKGNWHNGSPTKGKIVPKFKQAVLKYIQFDRSLNATNKIKFINGDVYKGQINAAFQPHGKGFFTFNKQSIMESYEGKWLNGRFHGQGICKWKDGSIYEGQYQNGQKQGHGKLAFASKKYYIGNWVNGYQSGLGTLYDEKDRAIKNGFWSSGQMHRSVQIIQNRDNTIYQLSKQNQKQSNSTKTKTSYWTNQLNKN